jgi:hypothetical protein
MSQLMLDYVCELGNVTGKGYWYYEYFPIDIHTKKLPEKYWRKQDIYPGFYG